MISMSVSSLRHVYEYAIIVFALSSSDIMIPNNMTGLHAYSFIDAVKYCSNIITAQNGHFWFKNLLA